MGPWTKKDPPSKKLFSNIFRFWLQKTQQKETQKNNSFDKTCTICLGEFFFHELKYPIRSRVNQQFKTRNKS